MLISIKDLKQIDEFQNIDDNTLKRKIIAIEIMIRQITHNNFQNRLKRILASSNSNVLHETCPYFKVGDTIEISESVNKGLYTIKAIGADYIEFNEDLIDEEHNLCTKIEYPADVIEGAVELLKWEVSSASSKSRNGIASETLSRHSVTYQSLDNNNTINGYPVSLLGFCDRYKKARF